MDYKIKNNTNLYRILFYVAVALLTTVGIISLFSPFYQKEIAFSSVLYAILFPGLFLLGFYSKKTFSIGDALLAIGVFVGIIVFVSTIFNWINFGFFQVIVYKDTPIYYWNGLYCDVTKEVIFLSSFSFKEVSIDYAGAIQIIAGIFLPSAFLIDRKTKKIDFTLSVLIGSSGLLALITLPNIKGLIILLIFSALIIIYKLFWKQKYLPKVFKYSFVITLTISIAFFVLARINAGLNFVFTGILDRIFVNNPIMNNVSSLLNYDNTGFINLFGLNNVILDAGSFGELASIRTGVFEVELLKEIGALGVVLIFIFIFISFFSVSAELDNKNYNDFQRGTSVVLILFIFVYCSLFYDQFPYTHDNTIYIPVLRYLPLLLVNYLLGMLFYFPNAKEKGVLK